MKKVLLIAALALGVSLMTSSQAVAQSSVYEAIGGKIAFGYLGDNPFVSMGAGHRRLFPGLYSATGMASMAYASMGVLGESMYDSMTFGMSPFAVSMGLQIKLRPEFSSISPLRNEFAILDRRTAVDLGAQVASGPSKPWTSLCAKEIEALDAK